LQEYLRAHNLTFNLIEIGRVDAVYEGHLPVKD